MLDKKLLLLIGVALLAISSLLYGILTPSTTRRRLSSGTHETPSGDSSTLKITAPLERSARKSSFLSWGRSPFSISDLGTGGRPVLNGIVWEEKSRQAIINDQIVQVGDRVGTLTLTTINPTSVTLSDGKHEFELTLGGKKS